MSATVASLDVRCGLLWGDARVRDPGLREPWRPRSVSLLYRSGRARPFGKIELDATDAASPAGSYCRLQLADPAGAYVIFTNRTMSLYFRKSTGGATRLAGQFDASGMATSANLYTAYVTSI